MVKARRKPIPFKNQVDQIANKYYIKSGGDLSRKDIFEMVSKRISDL